MALGQCAGAAICVCVCVCRTDDGQLLESYGRIKRSSVENGIKYVLQPQRRYPWQKSVK
jgi:hypothetical protein